MRRRAHSPAQTCGITSNARRTRGRGPRVEPYYRSVPEHPIRVHVLIDSLTWGGAEMLLGDLAAGAPAAGIELSVGFLFDRDGNPAGQRLRQRGIEPELSPVTGLLKPSALVAVRRQIAALRPDVVHTHLGYSDLLGGVAARSLRIPAVSTIHVMEWDRNLRERVKLRLMGLGRRFCASRVIAVSSAARDAFLERRWDRRDRIVVVHNGVEAVPMPGEGRAVRAELGIAPGHLVVAMVTALRPGKGHDVAGAAVTQLASTYPGLRLLILGDGPGREEIQRQLRSVGAATAFTGHRDDVMRVLDAVDVLLHPSTVDAFPTALLEAMAARVPVVASSTGGIPEIVEHERSGLLVPAPPQVAPVVEALDALLRDPALRGRLAAAGHERYRREFTAGDWAERLREVYEAALRERHH
jgi:glycosyltransferase involved in cell wall biosynthesis